LHCLGILYLFLVVSKIVSALKGTHELYGFCFHAKIGGSNMKKTILILLICLSMLTGCSVKQETPIEVPVVKKVYTETIKATTYTEKLTLSGTVIPMQTVKLSFKIPGVIAAVLVDEGDHVKKGQAIAQMDKSDYQIKVKAAQAEYQSAKLQMESEIPAKTNQAKAQYELTKTLYERVKNLYEKNAVTLSQMDEITTKLTVDENTYKQALDAQAIAETKLKMAEASLDYANSNVSDTTIYSPIDGVVLKKLMESGETADAGYPIVVIGQVDKVLVEIGVSDSYINSLSTGQKANVSVYGTEKTFEGSIDEIVTLADAKTRVFPVRIRLDNQSDELKSGMICKTDIILDDSEKLLVPLSSVVQLSDGSAVYVYSEGEQKAVRKKYRPVIL